MHRHPIIIIIISRHFDVESCRSEVGERADILQADTTYAADLLLQRTLYA
jgi:hypothetical protein